MSDNLKTCPKCGRELPKTEEYFFLNKQKGWWCTYCRDCERERIREKNRLKWRREYQHKRNLPTPQEILTERQLQEALEYKHKFRTCKTCGQEFPFTDEYFYNFSRECRSCVNEARRYKRVKDNLDPEWNIMQNPGEYQNEEERQDVHDFLTKIGWRYSPTTKIWYKPGRKSMHNKWKLKHQ